MSFRRPHYPRHLEARAWQSWLSLHASTLKSIGLPPGVTLTEAHWIDFLQNGHLHWHPDASDGFNFTQLSPEQMARLLMVLERSPQYLPHSLADWLRHRLASNTSSHTQSE